uniref:C2H2-type domain-containing protein n=1 Tax=Graphocephala atropunctata TaxID=36148 RepID=A0A1B6KNR9_9HEMI
MHLKELESIEEMGSKVKIGANGSSRRKDSDCNLIMECTSEDLSEAQLSAFNKALTQFKETSASVDSLLKAGLIEIPERGQDFISIEFKEGVNGINGSTPKPTTIVSGGSRPVVPVSSSASLLLQNTSMAHQSGGTYHLVMDPRALEQLYASSGTTQVSGSTVPVMAGVIQSSPGMAATVSTPVMTTAVLRQPTSQTAVRSVQPRAAPGSMMRSVQSTAMRPQLRPTALTSAPPLLPLNSVITNAPKTQNRNSPTTVRIKPGKSKATEASSIGGIVQNQSTTSNVPPKSSAVVVDLTDDDGRTNTLQADSKEVMFNKLSGKTYPSLVVVARPHLKTKEVSQAQIATERSTLDTKMKAVLMGTPTKFTEWLIQQGLVRSDQYCSIHVSSDMAPVKLKLGMYSDVSKFPYSGGYVWISECCPQRFVSVFSGSIFEGAPHAPTVLVKLLYHWSCQTNVNNIASWVKVDGLYVKSFYTNIRSVCTAAVHEKFEKLGGPKKRVELGVISLGTTSQDGNMRQVKVEVLGVYDPESKLIRLRAVEPLQDGERNYKRRFVKILEPLEEWVHKESVILTDYTVDKGTLHQMGYQSVYQVSMSDQQNTSAKYSNSAVMDYLRRIVPRMFQNTLSLLSRQIIQQFLDELVWRERWGVIPARAFETMISHLAEQTKLDTGDTLMTRLNKIASNPFKNWAYKNWQTNCSLTPAQPTARFIVGSNEPVSSSAAPSSGALPSIDNLPPSLRTADSPGLSQTNKRGRKTKAGSPGEPDPKRRAMAVVPATNKLRPLDSYYYGTIQGDPDILRQLKQIDLNMKCAICHMVIKDNLRMMRHLIGHAYNEGSYTFSDSSPQCRYCLKDFLSDFALQSHVEENHEKGALVCLICRETNRDRTTLILHMHHNHSELDLPYQCSICHFRTSQHNKLVDHFHEVHKNSEKLQCPFCLKIVSMLTVDGRKINQNQYFFISHIQKHQRKSLARKCNKCVLWFVHKDLIKEHTNKDHISCKDHPGVERFPADGIEAVMMPMPSSSGAAPPKSQGNKSKHTQLYNFTVNHFSVKITDVNENATCSECEGEILQDEHYPGYLSCLKCRFTTCCSKAMSEHCVIYHDRIQGKPQFNVGKLIILDKPMYCVCGFSSSSGNRLARHLAECKRKSAYPSSERAAQSTLQGQSASFPPLVTLDEEDTRDNEEKWLQAFTQPRSSAENPDTADKPAVAATSSSGDPPSMLNLLGLVRKPSTDESSLDKPPSDGDSATDVIEIDDK